MAKFTEFHQFHCFFGEARFLGRGSGGSLREAVPCKSKQFVPSTTIEPMDPSSQFPMSCLSSARCRVKKESGQESEQCPRMSACFFGVGIAVQLGVGFLHFVQNLREYPHERLPDAVWHCSHSRHALLQVVA